MALPAWAIPLKYAVFHGRPADEVVKRLGEETIPGLERLAVLELAAVFERTLRKHLARAATAQIATGSADELAFQELVIERIERWEFKELIDLFPSVDAADPHLSGMAKQIVERRNWVAHGKHSDPTEEEPTSVTPEIAYQRLTAFLIDGPVEAVGFVVQAGRLPELGQAGRLHHKKTDTTSRTV